MNKEIFNMISTPSIGTELYEGYEGLQTYIDLESYGGEMPGSFNKQTSTLSGLLKNRILVATIIVSSLWLNGCGSNGPQKTPPPTVQRLTGKATMAADGMQWSCDRVTKLNPDLSNLEEYKSNLNRYVVTVTMPAKNAEKALLVLQDEYKDVSNNVRPTVEYNGETATLTDTIDLSQSPLIERNFKYEIKIDSATLTPFKFTLKPDLLVQGQKKLSDLFILNKALQISTLFLDDGATFYTEGADLNIDVTHLISQHGKIESFSEVEARERTPVGQAGRHGGMLNIKTDLLVGDLEINLRGANGGRGVDGNPVTEMPTPGTPGRDSSESATCDRQMFSRQIKLFARDGDRPPRDREDRCVWICRTQATAGEPGKKGYPANPGWPGMTGGNSGIINFAAKESLAHSLNVSQTPGLGGDGGAASAPGKGSAAGTTGLKRHERCENAPPGSAPGADGDTALPGAPGVAGEKQTSCIQVGPQEKPCL